MIRKNLNPTPSLATLKFIVSEMNQVEGFDQPQVLKDLYYPIGSVQLSCIRLPQPTTNFKIKSQVISMLLKFSRIENVYIFMRKFEEVCATMKLQQLIKDDVKLRLINFILKDSAKKWLYSFLTSQLQHKTILSKCSSRNFFPIIKL